jgi:hypothetical protein
MQALISGYINFRIGVKLAARKESGAGPEIKSGVKPANDPEGFDLRSIAS